MKTHKNFQFVYDLFQNVSKNLINFKQFSKLICLRNNLGHCFHSPEIVKKVPKKENSKKRTTLICSCIYV